MPHPDRFVNLVVADLDELQAYPTLKGEIDRVLATRGATWLRESGAWKARRPAPDPRIDGWYSRWYDASGNSLGRDEVAGFPVAVQWQHGPVMEDGTADGKSLRVADGHAVHLSARSGELVCRDAGNGTFLWRRFVGLDHRADVVINSGRVHLWHDIATRRQDYPKKLTERGVLCAFDLRTGELVQQYDRGLTAGTVRPIEWKITDDRGRPRTRRQAPLPWFTVSDRVVVQAYARDLVVLDRVTGERLWQASCAKQLTWFSPVVSDDLLIACEVAVPARRSRHDGSAHAPAISAFRLASGKPQWRAEGVHREHEIRDKKRRYALVRVNRRSS